MCVGVLCGAVRCGAVWCGVHAPTHTYTHLHTNTHTHTRTHTHTHISSHTYRCPPTRTSTVAHQAEHLPQSTGRPMPQLRTTSKLPTGLGSVPLVASWGCHLGRTSALPFRRPRRHRRRRFDGHVTPSQGAWPARPGCRGALARLGRRLLVPPVWTLGQIEGFAQAQVSEST